MAEKTPINPKLTPETHAQFLTYCRTQRVTQSDAVEAALLAWLNPKDESDDIQLILEAIMDQGKAVLAQGQKIEGVEVAFGKVLQSLDRIAKHLEAQATPAAAPVADFFTVYPGLKRVTGEVTAPAATAAEAPEDLPVSTPRPWQVGWWKRHR